MHFCGRSFGVGWGDDFRCPLALQGDTMTANKIRARGHHAVLPGAAAISSTPGAGLQGGTPGMLGAPGIGIDLAAARRNSGNGTMSGPIYKTVFAGSGKYPGTLTITATGIVEPRLAGTAGLVVTAKISNANITNMGTIHGAYSPTGPAANGMDVLGKNATITNDGLIIGGYGASVPRTVYGAAGVKLSGRMTI